MGSLRKIPIYFLFVILFLSMNKDALAIDLSIDSFSTPQSAQASAQRAIAKSDHAAMAIGGHRGLSVLNTSKKGRIDAVVANHGLNTSFSDGAAGLVTIVWDGDVAPGLSTSSALNTKISLPLCDALVIGIESFTPNTKGVKIQARLYNPFVDGSQFLEGALSLSQSVQGATREIPISAMRAGGEGEMEKDFPLGAIVLTIDESVSLSSISLRCPPTAFVNLESSDYEMGLAGEPLPRRGVSRATTQGDSGVSGKIPPQGAKFPTPSATPTPTPPPAAVCGDGIIQKGEECDSGAAIANPACVNCKVVCPAPAKKAASESGRPRTGAAPSECTPPPTCGAPYKTCSQASKRGGSLCCYDPNTEDCITFSSWGHPIARCVPKQGSCKDPNGKECKSGKGDRACCPSDSSSSCAQGGGIAFCSFSACGPNQTACTTATGFRSEATMCCMNETEQCTKTIEIMGYLIQTCTANTTACANTGGTICMGNGAPRCCPAGTVCSASVDGFPNCVDKERTTTAPVAAAL